MVKLEERFSKRYLLMSLEMELGGFGLPFFSPMICFSMFLNLYSKRSSVARSFIGETGGWLSFSEMASSLASSNRFENDC